MYALVSMYLFASMYVYVRTYICPGSTYVSFAVDSTVTQNWEELGGEKLTILYHEANSMAYVSSNRLPQMLESHMETHQCNTTL